MAIDLYKRSELTVPLNQAQFDYNWTTVESSINTLEQTIFNLPANILSDPAFTETVDLRVSQLLVPGAHITLDYNDPANTLTISTDGDSDTLNGQLPAFYLSRANHTGTQLAATISDFSSAANAALASALAAKADLSSPIFVGIPLGPTAPPGTNTTQLATTEFVQQIISSLSGLDSPTFTGIPTAPTAAPGTNTDQLATTAFVSVAVANLINSAPGALDTLEELAAALGNDPNFATTITNELALKAPLASPVFTGIPTGPTATINDSSTQLATTAFVQNNLALYALLASPSFTGIPTGPTAAGGTNTTQLATTAFVTGAISTAVAPLAPLASPTFTGTPLSTTPSTADNSTKIATTAFVQSNLANYAPLASPAFTGAPTAPTVGTPSDSTTKLATTAFVQGAVAAAVAPGGSSATKRTAGATWDGQQTTIVAANSPDIFVTAPTNGTILAVYITTSGGNGSCVIDVRKTPIASFPPTGANSIVASTPPTITSGTNFTDTSLVGWSKTVTAGDVFAFHLTSVSVFTWIHIDLVYA